MNCIDIYSFKNSNEQKINLEFSYFSFLHDSMEINKRMKNTKTQENK